MPNLIDLKLTISMRKHTSSAYEATVSTSSNQIAFGKYWGETWVIGGNSSGFLASGDEAIIITLNK